MLSIRLHMRCCFTTYRARYHLAYVN